MKLDITKLVSVIGVAMNAVQAVKNAKGAEKEAAVITSVQQAVPEIEALAGVDFVNDPALNSLLSAYIQARVALGNAVAAAKQLKPAA